MIAKLDPEPRFFRLSKMEALLFTAIRESGSGGRPYSELLQLLRAHRRHYQYNKIQPDDEMSVLKQIIWRTNERIYAGGLRIRAKDGRYSLHRWEAA